jgi:hypothetical protein
LTLGLDGGEIVRSRRSIIGTVGHRLCSLTPSVHRAASLNADRPDRPFSRPSKVRNYLMYSRISPGAMNVAAPGSA